MRKKTGTCLFVSLLMAASACDLAVDEHDGQEDSVQLELAGPRPLFQLPFTCGDQWRLDTWAHAPALDMVREPNQVGTEGAPVLAPAAGTVNQSFRHSIDLPFGSLEVPDGQGWTVNKGCPTQIGGEDGTVVMLQSQDDITPDQRDDYLAGYHDVQMRDAPKYERVKQETGDILGAPGARVEGKFDNGTAFVTRDYLVFTKGEGRPRGRAHAVRRPGAAKLAALIDHMTATLAVK